MSKYKRPKIDEEKMDRGNPFVGNLRVSVRKQVYEQYIKTATGFELGERVLELEYTPFSRIYTTSEHRRIWNGLSSRAKELLQWIVYTIEYNKDWLWVNRERYMDESSIQSFNTYNAAVKELVDTLFLAKSTTQDVYFINPEFFFKGNRITKYRDKIEIINEKDEI